MLNRQFRRWVSGDRLVLLLKPLQIRSLQNNNVDPYPVHLAYGEPFVTTEFVRIGQPASTSSRIDGILEERLLS